MSVIVENKQSQSQNKSEPTLIFDEKSEPMNETKYPNGTECQGSTANEELQRAHRLLDAAEVALLGTLSDRLIWVAKQWFKSHTLSSQDHISPKFRAMLREAGELEFLSRG